MEQRTRQSGLRFLIGLLASLGMWTSATEGQAQFFRRMLQAMQVAEPATTDTGENLVLPFDRDLHRRLTLIEKEFEQGNFADAIAALGRLSQDRNQGDFFLMTDQKQRSRRSFKAEIQRLIAQLPPEALASYELQFGPEARRQLDEAVSKTDWPAIEDVARRYASTQAGYEALALVGEQLRLAQRPREAALCFARLHELPAARKQLDPQLSLVLALCWHQAGEPSEAEQVLWQLQQAQPKLVVQLAGGRKLPLFAQKEQALPWLKDWATAFAPVPLPARGDWLTAGGSLARQRQTPVETPLLLPRWQVEITTDAATQRAIETSRDRLVGKQATPLPIPQPLVVGNLVLQPTAQGVRAIDFGTGRIAWQFPATDDTNAGIDRTIWSNSPQTGLSSDGQRLFLIENQDYGSWGALDEELPPANVTLDSGRPSYNTLTARDIVPPRQANLLWFVGGRSGGSEPKLAGAYFLGAPLAAGDRLYAVAEINRVVRLVVLQAHNGRLDWWQDLGNVEQPIGQDPFRRLVGATASIDQGLVVCTTSCGTVVAVDLISRTLQWAYVYPRLDQTRYQPEMGRQPQLEQGKRWLDGHAVLAEGHVVLTPPESGEVHVLDLVTGKQLWSQPRGENLYLAGVSQGKAILVGKHAVTALNLADGKAAWPQPLPLSLGGTPAGRGICTESEYLLPLADGTLGRIDLSTGVMLDTLRSPRETVAGNLVWHDGQLISLGSRYLECFEPLQVAQQQVQAALSKDPRDPDALLRQGELHHAAGRTTEALASFRQAYEIRPTAHSKNRFTASLLDAVRGNRSAHPELVTELERLARP